MVVATLAVRVASAAPGSFPALVELSSLDGTIGFVLHGVNASDSSGAAVSGVGDVNGDGVDDALIGAPLASHGGILAPGESFVVFGRTTGFPATFELRTLHPQVGGDGSAGFILKGIDKNDFSGSSVSGAGDVNGDGIADVIIGADGAGPGRERWGASYVVFGRATGFPAVFELRGLHPQAGGDGSAGFVLKGVDSDDHSGCSVSDAGDVNGDGIADLLIGALASDPNGQESAGESYVLFGRTSGFPAAFELRSLYPQAGGDGGAGFVLKGIDGGDASGGSVSSAGDVNGDGLADVLIGASGAAPNGQALAGESDVVFGRATAFPAIFELSSLHPQLGGDGSTGFILKGVDVEDFSGLSVGGAGDVNGDGIADLLIGALRADPNGQSSAGESYVVFGRADFPATLELRSLYPQAGGDGSAGFVLRGIDADDLSGISVSSAGDVNGDGIADLIIGAAAADPGNSQDAGESYVVFGRESGYPAVFDLGSLHPQAGGDGSAGFVLNGIDADDSSGEAVSSAGDLNGDGVADLIIGASDADPNDQSDAGETYVVFGRGALAASGARSSQRVTPVVP
jgi:hypothetical protein